MPSLKHSSPAETAQRMREIAQGLTNPRDVDVTVRYALELERQARTAKSARS